MWAAVFVHVFFTFGLLFSMGALRVASIRRGEVHLRNVALGQPGWSKQATQVANCFHNQLETPILFYLWAIIIQLFQVHTPLFTVGAWAFVATRLAHGYVEITSNHVPTRFKIFAVGTFVLLFLWLGLAVQLILNSGHAQTQSHQTPPRKALSSETRSIISTAVSTPRGGSNPDPR